MMAVDTLSLPPPPSALDKIFSSSNGFSQPVERHATHLSNLALQIKHNLEFQHRWTDLRIHTETFTTTTTTKQKHIPCRPLISGLPPQRLYMHPEEQVALLSRSEKARRTDSKAQESTTDTQDADGIVALMRSVQPEREWVLPSHLNEKWSLRRFGQVFDCLDHVPPPPPQGDQGEQNQNPWRTTKKVLLATIDTDSTVAYYLVHDGIVKPRQN